MAMRSLQPQIKAIQQRYAGDQVSMRYLLAVLGRIIYTLHLLSIVYVV